MVSFQIYFEICWTKETVFIQVQCKKALNLWLIIYCKNEFRGNILFLQ